MTDERLRILEHAFRASGDPSDLGRWYVEAQRRGVVVDLSPLELAADCGSEPAAFTLGSDRVPGKVVCFRSLCRALRSCKGRVGKRARGHLAANLIRDLEVSAEHEELRQAILEELEGWSKTGRDAAERQRRGWHRLASFAESGVGSASEEGRRVARCLTTALWVLSNKHRRSAEQLEALFGLVSSGSLYLTRERLRAERPQRQALLRQAKRSIEAWAFAEVARALAEGQQTSGGAQQGQAKRPQVGVFGRG
jgi:hypothetical protein